jgi:hypothetical protein
MEAQGGFEEGSKGRQVVLEKEHEFRFEVDWDSTVEIKVKFFCFLIKL